MDTGASSHWGTDTVHANMAQVRFFSTPAVMLVSLQRCSQECNAHDQFPPRAPHGTPGYTGRARCRRLSGCYCCVITVSPHD